MRTLPVLFLLVADSLTLFLDAESLPVACLLAAESLALLIFTVAFSVDFASELVAVEGAAIASRAPDAVMEVSAASRVSVLLAVELYMKTPKE